jgi:AraC family ethanolamine operon transcriptional activator
MQNPQDLPRREVSFTTDECEELSLAQPERRRRYVRLRPGGFRGELRERSDGRVALAHESWSAALRVRCGRPRSYVVFSATASARAVWCGISFAGPAVLQLERDWEIATEGPFEACSFAVERARLENAEALLGREPRPGDNRLLHRADARALREHVERALAAPPLPAAAQRMLDGELLHLAATLRRSGDETGARVEPWSRRRAAVRRIEEYLDDHERELPALVDLCRVAGTSERTLEYACREQLGTTLAGYRRLRRLHGARRDLRGAEPGTKVSDVALRWGFWQLGRFAVQYRTLFGQRPSDTLGSAG